VYCETRLGFNVRLDLVFKFWLDNFQFARVASRQVEASTARWSWTCNRPRRAVDFRKFLSVDCDSRGDHDKTILPPPWSVIGASALWQESEYKTHGMKLEPVGLTSGTSATY